jgi:hypothetical protein
MTDAYRKINLFGVWGRERIMAVAAEATRDSRKLEVLAEIRSRNKREIDAAAEAISEMTDSDERLRYAAGLPLAFQTIIILDCLRELEKVIKEIMGP